MKMRQSEGESQRLQSPVEELQGCLTKGQVDVSIADLVAKLEDFADGEVFLEGGRRLFKAGEAEVDVTWEDWELRCC